MRGKDAMRSRYCYLTATFLFLIVIVSPLTLSPTSLSRRAFLLASAPLTLLDAAVSPPPPFVPSYLGILSLDAAANTKEDKWTMGKYPDPALRLRASRVPPSSIPSSSLSSAAQKLRRTCLINGAVGLAAQQCGVDASIVYLNDGSLDGLTLINPRVVARSREVDMKTWNEFCLVMPPGLKVTLLRDFEVTVEYETLSGETKTRLFDGELARAVQHEMDHDLGVLIVDHADLSELPPEIRDREAEMHAERQARAFSRSVTCGQEVGISQLRSDKNSSLLSSSLLQTFLPCRYNIRRSAREGSQRDVSSAHSQNPRRPGPRSSTCPGRELREFTGCLAKVNVSASQLASD